MGVTFVDITIRPTHGANESREERCMVDTGATTTVLPAATLSALGVTPVDEQIYGLADGTKITRRRGWAYVELQGRGAYTRVVFGEEGDSNLLGVLTLEELEFFVDPLHRELHQLDQHL